MGFGGWIHMNVPIGGVPAFLAAALAVAGLALQVEDKRYIGFTRYRINVQSAARHPFLTRWAATTMN